MDSMSPTAAKVPSVAQEITSKLVNDFKDNLVTVLLYGSSRYSEEYWDLDILVILRKNQLSISDALIFKNIAEKYSNHSLDLQFVYLDEIRDPDIFSLDAHGAFFSRIVKHAVILYGENPFERAYEASQKIFLVSIIVRIQRYVFHARQEYILGGRHNKDRNPRYHRKHVIRTMFDVLLMSREWLEPEEVKELFSRQFPDCLNALEWGILDSQSDDINDYILLYEKIYAVAHKEVRRCLIEI